MTRRVAVALMLLAAGCARPAPQPPQAPPRAIVALAADPESGDVGRLTVSSPAGWVGGVAGSGAASAAATVATVSSLSAPSDSGDHGRRKPGRRWLAVMGTKLLLGLYGAACTQGGAAVPHPSAASGPCCSRLRYPWGPGLQYPTARLLPSARCST